MLKVAVIWDIASCNLVLTGDSEVLTASIVGAISGTSVKFYQTARRNNSEDSHDQVRRCENMNSQR